MLSYRFSTYPVSIGGIMKHITAFIVAASLSIAIPVHASMVLTPAGVAQNLTLATYAFNFSSSINGVGPVGALGIGSNSVLVSSYADGTVKVMPDVNGQDASTATSAGPYSAPTGLAMLNGNIYLAEQGSGKIDQINANGTLNQVLTSAVPLATGLAANPGANLLYVSDGHGIDAVDLSGNVTNLLPGVFDGLTMDSTHNILYAESGSHILGYSLSGPPTVVFDSGAISGADGAALGTGTLAGLLFVNTNFGELWEVNLTSLVQTMIASGGSRGDLVGVDTNDGSMLLSQTDSELRLSLTSGGGFGSVPEPGSIVLMLTGLAGMGVAIRKKRTGKA